MHSPKWTVVAKTSPIDAQAAQEQERWLKLADDALDNRKRSVEPQNIHVLEPGERARRELKAIARELQNTLRKYLKQA